MSSSIDTFTVEESDTPPGAVDGWDDRWDRDWDDSVREVAAGFAAYGDDMDDMHDVHDMHDGDDGDDVQDADDVDELATDEPATDEVDVDGWAAASGRHAGPYVEGPEADDRDHTADTDDIGDTEDPDAASLEADEVR